MKKRFGVEQKIRILREAEGGVSGSEIASILRAAFNGFGRFHPIEFFASVKCSGVRTEFRAYLCICWLFRIVGKERR